MNLMKGYDPDISIKELFHNPAKINVRFSRNFSCITGSSYPRISPPRETRPVYLIWFIQLVLHVMGVNDFLNYFRFGFSFEKYIILYFNIILNRSLCMIWGSIQLYIGSDRCLNIRNFLIRPKRSKEWTANICFLDLLNESKKSYAGRG